MRDFFAKVPALVIGVVFIMPATVVLIVVIYIVKFFRGYNIKDPFHNSRQHPLNSPEAPRG